MDQPELAMNGATPGTAPSTAPDPTAVAVAKCMAILEQDPRTAELAQMIPGAIASLAAINGASAEVGAGLPPDMMAEVFQGISDAWSKANQ